jgi:DNA-binding response OmpR family regulator
MSRDKILIVEDDPAILTGLIDLLEGEGYDVRSARDGGAALRAYQSEAPALILLDIMIPEKSGLDVCREIRRKDAWTPIVMLTAKGQEVDKVVGLELGADDYVVKPFGVGELLARVRAALRRAAAGRSSTVSPSWMKSGASAMKGRRGPSISISPSCGRKSRTIRPSPASSRPSTGWAIDSAAAPADGWTVLSAPAARPKGALYTHLRSC